MREAMSRLGVPEVEEDLLPLRALFVLPCRSPLLWLRL